MTFDYETLRNLLITKLQSKASWATILPYSVNRRLIDTIAEGMAELAAYDEFLLREQKWDLAQEVSSLLTNSKFLGYDASRKVGATGVLKVSTSATFNATPSKIVVIPKYSTFSNGDDIQFVSVSAYNILTTDNYIEINTVQGTPIELTFVAAGDNYEEIEVIDDSFENVYYDVYVNSVEWAEVSDLNNYDDDDKVYTLKNKVDFSGVDIQFGNNIFGKKLTAGDTVKVNYVQTLGIEGNVVSSDIIDTVESTVYDIDSNEVTIYCTNENNLDGGTDEETVDEIRTNGIDTFQAGEKAVVAADYETLMKEKSYVQNAVVWGAYEENIINNNDPWEFISSEENVVHVSAYTPAGEQLTTNQKTETIEYLNPNKPPEDIVLFEDVDFISMAFNVSVYLTDESYIPSDVKSAIITALTNEFALTNRDFYQHIYDTVWKKIISDIDGVLYHNSYIELMETSLSFESASKDLSTTLPVYEVQTGTVKIYAKETGGSYVKIATDDGANGFTAETGYTVAGAINYDTGAITSFTVTSGLDEAYTAYTLKIYYQTIDENNEDNLVLKEINQIFKIEEITNITAQYSTAIGE